MSTFEDEEQFEGLPILPHQAAEFCTWLWWASEEQGGHFRIGEEAFDLWVDDRLAFRHPSDLKITAVLTGENPSTTREARAALAGGKVIQELRLSMRREDREYTFTLKGPHLDLAAAKLPQAVDEGDGVIYDRMFLYEHVSSAVSALFKQFIVLRTSAAWDDEVVPAIRAWMQSAEQTG